MNRTIGFDVDNKRYTLKYDFNAICDIEELAGVGINTLLTGDKVGMNAIRLVIWGGLKWKMQGLTKQATGDLIKKFADQGGDLSKLANDAIKLLGESSGSKQTETDDDAENETVGES